MTLKHKSLLFTIAMFVMPELMAGQTPILNSDLPSGSGDWEGHEHNLVAECEITTGKYKGIYRSDNPDLRLPVGYHCTPNGSMCSNKYAKPQNSCVNTKVRWHWINGNTPWFDRDLPTGQTDYEAIELQLKLECIFGDKTFIPGDELPKGYTCHRLKGAWCDNSETQPLNNCKHAPVRVRYFW